MFKSLIKTITFFYFFLCVSAFANEIQFSGLIVSDNQKTISSKYSGFVQTVYVKEGSIVKKDEPLLQIDSQELQTRKREIQLSVQQNQLQLNSLQLEYKKTAADHNRYEKLFEKEMISKSRFEELTLKKETLENNLKITKKETLQLKKELERINKEFKYLDIKAPNSGLIIKKDINEGELTSPAKSLLTLCDVNDLVIYLDVGESQLKAFKMNSFVDVTIESIVVKTKAKVEAILPNIDPTFGNFRVKLALEKSDTNILPGMYAVIKTTKVK